MNDATNLILNSALGAELSQEEAKTISEMMHLRELQDDEYLIEEGTTDDALHVILGGKLEVVKRTSSNGMASLAILREGDIAGELSFIDGTQHTVGLRALSSSLVLSLRRADFEAIVEENPRLVYKVMRAVARSAHKIVHHMNSECIELTNYIFKQHGRY